MSFKFKCERCEREIETINEYQHKYNVEQHIEMHIRKDKRKKLPRGRPFKQH